MGQIEKGTLLVTSAVRSTDPSLKIKDHNTRMLQLYCSMICWITCTRVKNIVLCDNTGSDTLFPGLESLAAEHGKYLEILRFQGDQGRVATLGKGYGEGEIIRYALGNSAVLSNETTFYKVTGRVFVENFDEILDAEVNNEVVFNLRTAPYKMAVWRLLAHLPGMSVFWNSGHGYIPTVFYKCSVRYYAAYLAGCHEQVNDREDIFLEHRMFLPLMRHGFSTFTIPPQLTGRSAGTGLLYGSRDFSASIQEHARRLACLAI